MHSTSNILRQYRWNFTRREQKSLPRFTPLILSDKDFSTPRLPNVPHVSALQIKYHRYNIKNNPAFHLVESIPFSDFSFLRSNSRKINLFESFSNFSFLSSRFLIYSVGQRHLRFWQPLLPYKRIKHTPLPEHVRIKSAPDCLPENFLPLHRNTRCPKLFVKKLLRSSAALLLHTLHLVYLKVFLEPCLELNFRIILPRVLAPFQRANQSSCFFFF